MARTTRLNVEVTERDIERARRNDSYTCVVAQAVARTVPDATRIDVDTQTIRFTKDGERLVYLTPYAVQGYVIAFDAGDDIAPFSFQIRDPQRARRRLKTTAGKLAMKEAARARRKRTTAPKGDLQAPVDHSDASAAEAAAAVKAAYAEARAAHANTRATVSDGGGRKATPRVFKKKQRSYGHRLLRINQDAQA